MIVSGVVRPNNKTNSSGIHSQTLENTPAFCAYQPRFVMIIADLPAEMKPLAIACAIFPPPMKPIRNNFPDIFLLFTFANQTEIFDLCLGSVLGNL